MSLNEKDDNICCPNCGKLIPKDSDFCQYCGAEISNILAEQIDKVGEDIAQNSQQAHVDEAFNGANQVKDIAINEKPLEPKTQITSGTKNTSKPFIVLIIIVVILAGLNIFQFASYSKDKALVGDLQTELSGKDATLQEKEKTISEKDSKIKSLNNQISELQDKADSYQRIVSGLSSGSLGAYSSDFKASNSVIVVNSGSTKTFTITTTLSYDAAVHIENDYPSIATADFAADSWYDSVNIKVSAKKKGTTILNFVEENNNLSFKVLVIVV